MRKEDDVRLVPDHGPRPRDIVPQQGRPDRIDRLVVQIREIAIPGREDRWLEVRMLSIAHVLQQLQGSPLFRRRGLGPGFDIFDIFEELVEHDVVRCCEECLVWPSLDDGGFRVAHLDWTATSLMDRCETARKACKKPGVKQSRAEP